DRNAVLDSDVVLTKMKLLNNFNEKFRSTENSTLSAAPVSEHDTPDPGEASEVNSHPEDKSRMDSGAGYLPGIFSNSHLSRLYKFESEDSGVELPSGANSPSTPTGSEKSFAVHSRESSCHCCNLDSDSTSSPDALATEDQNSKEANGLKNSTNSTVGTQDDVFTDRDDFDPSVVTAKLYICEEMDQRDDTGFTSEDVRERSDRRDEKISSDDKNCSESIKPADEFLPARCKDETDEDIKAESLRRSDTRDSLEDYMDTCCKLSEQAQQQRSSALGSGLGYLEHICQLLEKIARLQEANIRLQRQVCSLQRDGRMRKTKERYCSCGSATLAFQNWQSKSDFPSPSGTSSDLSTIPEVGWHPLLSARKWRRSQNQRSYAEREPHHHGDGTELSENYMWGRVKDLVRKSKGKNQSGLGLTSASLKLSCPQLYNRNSMIVLG
uniref:Si:ch211-250c4.4 n=1 Tax=Xiphophorus maculatus TaxID=8083 RepID=A0A3B5RC15_XIPMA